MIREKMLSELARLGARLIIQRAVEEEFDTWLGRARYERRPQTGRGRRGNGCATGSALATCRPRRVSCGSRSRRRGRRRCRSLEAVPEVALQAVLRTDPLKALIIGGFVRGLSMRDVESLCEEAGLGKTSKSTVATICAELRERFGAFCRRSLYDVRLVVLFLDAISSPVRPSGPKEGVICAWGIMRTATASWFPSGWGCASPRRTGSRSAATSPPADSPHRGWSSPTARPDCQARSSRSGRRRSSTLRRSPPGTSWRSCPTRTRSDQLDYWSALDRRHQRQADGKLRLQVLIIRTRAWRLRVRRSLPLRRPRRLGRAPALPAQTPRTLALNEPPRTLARRGPPAHQGDGPLPRREQLPRTRLGSTRPVLSATPATAPRSPTSTAGTSTASNTTKPTLTPSTRRSQPPRLPTREPKPRANLQR